MKKRDKDRLNKISQMGCFCCGLPAEVHHIRSHTGFSVRPDHQQTIPLCPTHHRTGKDSIHLGKNLFIENLELNILSCIKSTNNLNLWKMLIIYLEKNNGRDE